MFVFVCNQHGHPLMPCSPAKARRLLKERKAKVVKRTPFTIQLLYGSSGYKQPVVLGVDAGSKTIGLSATSGNQELFAGELTPRNDVVNLLSARREFRRARRNRTTRYRKPRFDNRVHTKHKGWLAPSVEVKIHNHIQSIMLAMKILPVTKLVVETGEFDIQAIKALEAGQPLPSGTDYQTGELYGEYNVRQYVLHRDGYRCRKCGCHGKDVRLHVHHLESRKVGSEAPSNKITLCEACHKKYHKGIIDLSNIKKGRSYRDAAFMGIMRPTLMERIRLLFPGLQVAETKGFITKYAREKYAITKTHINDARCISGCPQAKPADEQFLMKPVRSNNRQLHKATILHGGYRKRNQAPKYVFGFQLFDKVRYQNTDCFIFGRRASGSFDIRHLDGKRVSAGVSCKKLTLVEKRKSVLIERRKVLIS